MSKLAVFRASRHAAGDSVKKQNCEKVTAIDLFENAGGEFLPLFMENLKTMH